MKLTVMIEIPKGSRNKYEYDKEKKIIKYDRMLYSSVHYPADYGFIPNTLAEDGDPLDALVLLWEPSFPGCVINVRPIGLFNMRDEKGTDEKVLCVPIGDPMWNHVKDLKEAPPHLLREIENFFDTYKKLEEKETEVIGWADSKEALKVIEKARRAYASESADI